ncbi:MAG: AlpA family phage regulatory protein [gamma proteobacterium symbiont of Taylorina sp.]|nr:AlpA family phage regulatory protein [gamma proteobacterium symbiont of Taylorina sp.]
MANQHIYRKPYLRKLTGLSDSTIWRLEKKGDFPKRRKITARLVGWLKTEVDAWIENREVA